MSETVRNDFFFGSLCAACLRGRPIVSGRGSTFLLCEHSQDDPRFPKYPTQPVVSCGEFRNRAVKAETRER